MDRRMKIGTQDAITHVQNEIILLLLNRINTFHFTWKKKEELKELLNFK